MDDYTLVACVLCVFVGILWYLKRTDFMVGCTKWREQGCENMLKCPYPNCSGAKEYKSVKWFK